MPLEFESKSDPPNLDELFLSAASDGCAGIE